jgi:FAD/FMN-containing dehydrogenase
MIYSPSALELHRKATKNWLQQADENQLPLSKEVCLDLISQIRGKIVFPWTPGYDTAKQDFNNAWPVNPLAIIYAASYDDIKFSLSFAKTNRIPFCIRSGGHSLAGYSVCSGLILDMSQLRNIRVDPVQRIAFVEAGCTFEQIFPIIEQYNLHMPSGECPTVAVAGFMLGGGYGFTSRNFGLGCDVVENITVMLASGRIVMASRLQNQDLFWALRGGTGGNFGVLLNITYRLVPLGNIYGVKLGWDFHDDSTNAAQAMAYIQANLIPGMSYAALGIELAIVVGAGGRQMLYFCATWPGTGSALDQILAPLLAMRGCQPILRIQGKYFGINEALLANTPDVPPGSMAFSRTTIIDRLLSGMEWAMILDFFKTAPNQYTTVGIECYGGVINQVPVDQTAFIHRNAYLDFFCDAIFTDQSDDRRQNELWSEAYYSFMKKFGNGHSYQNYPNRKQTDFRWAFWGPAYNRLLAIKQKYDPENDFTFEQSIGPYLTSIPAEFDHDLEIQNPIVYENW